MPGDSIWARREPVQSLAKKRCLRLLRIIVPRNILLEIIYVSQNNMQFPTSLFVAAVTLGISRVTNAVCTGNSIAVGTPTTLASGNTQWNIYDTSCNLKNTYQQSSAVSVCDSQVFYCTFGTTNIDQYDDPVSGWAYNCTLDATVEACGSDTILSCVSPSSFSNSSPLLKQWTQTR